MEDPHLLRALVLPFLPGIVARAVGAATPAAAPAGKRADAAPPSPPPRMKPQVTGAVLDRLADQWSQRFDAGPKDGAEDATDRQATSLRNLAVAHARRRYDPDRPED